MFFRNKEKYKKFFIENKEIIIKNNFYLNILNKNPFIKYIEFNEINYLLDKKIFYLLKYL